MRCHICNSDTDTVVFDKASKEFTPCSECQTAIFECVSTYDSTEFDEDAILEVDSDVGC